MPLYKNVASQKLAVYAHDILADTGKTGDAGNITAQISKDGGATAATDDVNPAELDAADAPGIYIFDLTQGESNADLVIVSPVSSTGNIKIETVIVYTSPQINVSSGVVEADAVQLHGDPAAAANLESQFDGTGLAGDTYPATQSQLAGIANVGAAVNRTADSYTLTTGTQSSGTVASTRALDGTNHEHTDDAGAMDLYYEFLIGSGIPTSVIVTGYLNGNNDDLEVYGYDWVATAWVRIGTLAGKAASTNEVQSYDLFVDMVGSGGDVGKVRIRFTDGAFTLSAATLAIDQIFVSFSRGAEGYANGSIWINTNASNTNTVVGIDGTATNPVSTIAAANTLAASTGLNRFEIAAGSSITLGVAQNNQMFHGMNWTLVLNGQSVSNTHISGAMVSGICTGASPPLFTDCHFGATTLPPSHMTGCGLENTITAGSAGNFFFDGCHSGIAGASDPIFDFGGGLNASQVNFSGYYGGIEIQNMGTGSGTYNLSLEGDGQLTINVNCSATSNVVLRGNFRLVDNAGGAVTVTTDDDTADINDILVDTAEMQPKLPANFIMGSSDQTDKDDEIDGIKAVTDLLPDAGALNDLTTLVGRLTAARAGYLDELAAANIPADVDTLLGRLTAVRAGYLDELAGANLPTDIDGIKAVTDLLPDAGALNDLATLVARLTAARAGYLDELAAANLPADIDGIKAVTDLLPDAGALDDLATLVGRLTAARAGYLDELAAVNIPADVDTLLGRLTAARAGYLDALNGHTAQSGDNFPRLGAPAGASVSADIALLQADTDNIQSRIPAALVGGRMDSDVGNMQNNVITAASIATDAIGADEIAAGAVTEIASGVDVTLTAAHGAGSWATGAAAPTVVQIRQEMDANSTQLAQIIADIGNLNDIDVADLLAGVVDGTIDVKEAFTVIMSLLSAKGSSVAANVYSFKQQDDTVKVVQTIGPATVTSVIS